MSGSGWISQRLAQWAYLVTWSKVGTKLFCTRSNTHPCGCERWLMLVSIQTIYNFCWAKYNMLHNQGKWLLQSNLFWTKDCQQASDSPKMHLEFTCPLWNGSQVETPSYCLMDCNGVQFVWHVFSGLGVTFKLSISLEHISYSVRHSIHLMLMELAITLYFIVNP